MLKKIANDLLKNYTSRSSHDLKSRERMNGYTRSNSLYEGCNSVIIISYEH